MSKNSIAYNGIHALVKYRIEFCNSLIKWMARGYSYGTWGVDPLGDGSVCLSRTTLYAWEKDYPEWAEAKKKGYEAGLKFFETLLINSTMGVIPKSLKDLESKGINLSAVIFTLKTRFHEEFAEKSIVDHTSSDNSIKISFVEACDENKKKSDPE